MSTTKNPHAVALGRKGGKARATKRTPEELSAIGKKAVSVRESKKRKAK